MTKHRTIVGYLSWLTDENYDFRNARHDQSISSLSNLSSQCHVAIINNGGIFETYDKVSKKIDNFTYVDLKKNFFDIAAQLVPHRLAKKYNIPYFINAYDDFIFYDSNFIKAAESFMDNNKNISCMRMPKYSHKNFHEYDTRYTPKSTNPESVSHHPGAGNLNLNNHGPYKFGNKNFYISNWRPISRPTLWRTESFDIFIREDDLPIMQSFEAHMHKIADDLIHKNEYMSSFIDMGVCHTFPIQFSDRTSTNVDKKNIRINKNEIYEIVESVNFIA